jgi:hypothetical protein
VEGWKSWAAEEEVDAVYKAEESAQAGVALTLEI